MRLTLRTLLAHMDGLLPADDAQEIGKKIQESEFASSLSLRIRDCMRRLRLGAPSINERGSGLDPNTVAEYLEYRLSDARVQDFERVCLESDVHLAEVASCHQILTAILGEPVEIDADSRRRMYQVPASLAAGDVPRADEVDAPPVVVPPPALPSDNAFEMQPAHRPVPAGSGMASRGASAYWLRRLWQGLALLAVAALIVVFAAVQFRPNSPLAKLFSRSAAPEDPAKDSSQDTAENGEDEAPPADGGENAQRSGPATGSGERAEEGDRAGSPASLRGDSDVAPARIIPVDEGPAPSGKAAADAAGAAAGKRPAPAGDVGKERPAPKPKGRPDERPADEDPDDGIPPAPAANPQVAAQFVGGTQVALRIESRDGQAYRMADLRLLQPRDAVISLPGFRPEFVLPGKLRVTLLGGALMTMLSPDADGVAGVAMERGRLLARAESPAGAKFRFRAQDTTGLLTLAEESVAAIEVARAENPGMDPETQPGPLAVDLYVLAGTATWRSGNDAKPRELKAPVRAVLSDRQGELAPLQQAPRWVNEESADPLEQRAAVVVERGLPPDKPVGLRLRELADHRQKEVHALAERAMALTGDVEPLVEALNLAEQRLAWSDVIAELKSTVVAGPQSAAAVRSAMEKAYGPSGAALYPLLWKYGPQPPAGDALAELIGGLEHSQLAFRVLAFWNLKTLTGQNYAYRPEETLQRRQAAVQRWRDRTSAKTSGKTSGKASGKPSDKPVGKPSAKPLPEALIDTAPPRKAGEKPGKARPSGDEPPTEGVDY